MTAFFYIATGVKPTRQGSVITTTRNVIDKESISRIEIISKIVGDSGMNLLFFYLEKEYMPAGTYAVTITAQSPQFPNGGYTMKSARYTTEIAEGTMCSDAFAMATSRAEIPNGWCIMFFELRPDRM